MAEYSPYGRIIDYAESYSDSRKARILEERNMADRKEAATAATTQIRNDPASKEGSGKDPFPLRRSEFADRISRMLADYFLKVSPSAAMADADRIAEYSVDDAAGSYSYRVLASDIPYDYAKFYKPKLDALKDGDSPEEVSETNNKRLILFSDGSEDSAISEMARMAICRQIGGADNKWKEGL
jgi:hypothetical protein